MKLLMGQVCKPQSRRPEAGPGTHPCGVVALRGCQRMVVVFSSRSIIAGIMLSCTHTGILSSITCLPYRKATWHLRLPSTGQASEQASTLMCDFGNLKKN